MKTVLTLEEIVKNYSNIRRVEGFTDMKYVARNQNCDFLEIYDLGQGEIRFVFDNFPRLRTVFSTNIPYYSLEQFESDLSRIDIEIFTGRDNKFHLSKK